MSARCGCGGSFTPGGCGCCEGTEPATPRPVVNPPGRDSLDCRAGTHGSFMASMLARLSASEYPELHELTARTGDDAGIALLDAWATVGDVLTFYQERIANEGFLRTATERRSLVESARLVAYEPRPGVSASVYLAYTLDKDLKGQDTVVTIPRGSRAQSVPVGGDELPVPFETSEDLVAGSAWNNLEPRRWKPVELVAARASELAVLYFDGVMTGLKPGDVVLLLFGDAGEERVPLFVKRVQTEQIVPDPPGPPLGRTIASFQQPLGGGLAKAIAALQAVLADARDLEKHGVAASPTARAADEQVLAPVEARVAAGPSASQLARTLDRAVRSLRERMLMAAAKGQKKVAA